MGIGGIVVLPKSLREKIIRYGNLNLEVRNLNLEISEELGNVLKGFFPNEDVDTLVSSLYATDVLPNGMSTEIMAYLANAESDDVEGIVSLLNDFLKEVREDVKGRVR